MQRQHWTTRFANHAMGGRSENQPVHDRRCPDSHHDKLDTLIRDGPENLLICASADDTFDGLGPNTYVVRYRSAQPRHRLVLQVLIILRE